MFPSSKVAKAKNTKTSRKKATQTVTSNVTRALRSRGKFPKKSKVELPKKTIGKKIIKGKGKEKIEEQEISHEHEREFELIQIDSDAEDDEANILISLLQNREAQIKDLENGLERSKDITHYLQLQNNQMSGHMEVFEARALKYKREAQKSQVRLE